MNLTTFRMYVAYISMAIFLAIPIVNTLMDSPLSITELLISYAIAIGFGIYATTQLEKYDKEKKKDNSHFEEFKDTILKEKCPKCNSKLMELKNLTKDFTLNAFYKGLVYCTECDYEVSRDEFDKEKKERFF